MGALNLVPTYVQFPNHQKLVMLGEQEASVFLAPGDYTFFAHSSDGNDPYFSTNRLAWVSNKVTVELQPNDRIRYVLDGSDHQGWKLRLAD